ncbi:MAG: CHAT domain-containing protein [Cyanobium sp.]
MPRRIRSLRLRRLAFSALILVSCGLLLVGAARSDPYPPAIREAGERAMALARAGQFEQAIPLWQQLQQWQSQQFGPKDPRSLRSLRNLAGLHLGAGDPQAAAAVLRRHLSLVQELDGQAGMDTALALLELAKPVRTLARFDEAESLTRTALRLLEALPASLARQKAEADSHELLGVIAHERGDYPLAEQEHRRALALRRPLGVSLPLQLANSLANVAQALMRQGQFAEALDLQRQALALLRSHPDQESRGQQATVLSNMGLNHDLLGHREAALATLREALSIRLRVSGGDHPETARLRLNLGALEVSDGALSSGLSHYRQALAALERRMGPDHISTAFAVQRIAELMADQGRPEQARQGFQRVLALRRAQLRTDHPDLATTLLALALVELQLGRSGLAVSHLRETLSIRERAFGAHHPYTALTRLLLAQIAWQEGRQTEASRHFQATTRAISHFLQGEAALLPIRERRRLLATIRQSRQVIYSLALQGAAGREIALEARLNLHGLLEELERRQITLLRRDPAQARQLATLAGLTQQLSGLEPTAPERPMLLARQDAIERALFRQLAQSLAPSRTISSAGIARQLSREAVLVEFLRVEPSRLQAGFFRATGAPRYAALVLHPSGQVNAVDLGPVEPINRAIWTALAQTQRIDSQAPEAWAQVSERILQPLLSQIGSSAVWYLSPDAELHRVPFAALAIRSQSGPSGQQERRLVGERYRIRLLTSARELQAAADRSGPGRSLVLADPDFDLVLRHRSADPPLPLSLQRGQPLPDLWRSQRWNRLPGSLEEGAAIQRLIGSRLLTGAAARKQVLAEVVSPRFLHVVSHGAFLPRGASSRRPPGNWLREMGQPWDADDPMLRGVIVMAGANRVSGNDAEDGFLTALEVSRLDLRGTDLVTLSACETGLGAIELGDGLYGLRRGIAVAGARSSLLSLWKVSDRATQVLMQTFYQHLSQGRSPEQALALAQAFLQQHDNLDWRHPFYWAAFQLYGRSW